MFWKNILPKKISRYIDKAINVVLVVLLLIGCYFIYDAWYVFYYDESAIAQYSPEVADPEKLREMSKDAVGWIHMHDTNLDFPIVQGKDNVEYLNKSADGKYSLAGAIFLDCRNTPDFSDPYNLVYGHHMTNHQMFGVLDLWEDKEHFEKYKYGTLYLLDGTEKKVQVVAFSYCTSMDEEVFDCEGEYDRLEFVKQNHEHFREPEGNQLLNLTTCRQPNSTKREMLLLSVLE